MSRLGYLVGGFGGHDDFAGRGTVFHVSMGFDDLVELVDAMNRYGHVGRRDIVQEPLEDVGRKIVCPPPSAVSRTPLGMYSIG